MIIPVVRIGNSQGIRLPKAILEQCNIEKEVDVQVSGENITIRPHRKPRQGWEEQMQKMHERGDDHLILPEHIDADMED